jgi:hypothetical protein
VFPFRSFPLSFLGWMNGWIDGSLHDKSVSAGVCGFHSLGESPYFSSDKNKKIFMYDTQKSKGAPLTRIWQNDMGFHGPVNIRRTNRPERQFGGDPARLFRGEARRCRRTMETRNEWLVIIRGGVVMVAEMEGFGWHFSTCQFEAIVYCTYR